MSVTYTPASIPVKASKTQPGPDSVKKEITITPPKEKEAETTEAAEAKAKEAAEAAEAKAKKG